LAQKQRNEQPKGQDFSYPYIITKMEAISCNNDSAILITFQTQWGFPVEVALTRELSQSLIEKLQEELRPKGTQSQVPWKPS
jgi:hypothetical protein